jgi:hypothetical protein
MSSEFNIAPADRLFPPEPRINAGTRPATLGTFEDAQINLLAYVRDRIRNGELTERGFARQIGISQPHAHNALKGVRTLSPDVLDAILRYFHLSLLDLLSRPTRPGVIT